MEILVVIYSLGSGGAERVTVNLCNYWADKGWSVRILTFTSVDDDFYDLHSDIERVGLGLDSKSRNIFDALKNNFKRINALRSFIKYDESDYVLGMMTTANCLLALANIGVNKKIIGCEQIHPPMLKLGSIWQYIRKYCYKYLETVVALTDRSANWIRRNTNAKRVAVIPNPVTYPIGNHQPIVDPSTVMRESDATNFILGVGRLVDQKGFERLLHAFSKIESKYRDWCLVILGEGEKRNYLEGIITNLDLNNRVFMPGNVGNIGQWYNSADIYTLPSRFEGFPNTLMEALAYGLPSVAVDCKTGPRDILRHKVDGILVSDYDEGEFIDALETLMKNKDLRNKYAANASQARQRFSIEKISNEWEKLFHNI